MNKIKPNRFQRGIINRLGLDEWLDEKRRDWANDVSIEYDDSIQAFEQKEYRHWFNGRSAGLEHFYRTNKSPALKRQRRFWEVVNTEMPRAHFPLASTISNAFGTLLFNEEIEFNIDAGGKRKSKELSKKLEHILDINDIQILLQTSARLQSYSGKVGFKINYDPTLIDVPLITSYPKERMKVEERYNQIVYIDFIDYFEGNYKLISRYGRGYINYKLFHKERQIPLNSIPETSGLQDIAFFDKDGYLVPIIFATVIGNKTKEGQSDYQGLTDTFHALDETYSTLITYIRRTKPNIFITEDIAKKDKHGNILPLNEFDNIITILDKRNRDDNNTSIERSIEEVKIQGYIDTLNQLRNTVLERIGLSPATIGIDSAGANASAEAIRIREGASIKTRGEKLAVWKEALEDFFVALLNFDYFMEVGEETRKGVYEVPEYFDFDLKVMFGEYAKETFAERAEVYTELYEKGLGSIAFTLTQIFGKVLSEEELDRLIAETKQENGKELTEREKLILEESGAVKEKDN